MFLWLPGIEEQHGEGKRLDNILHDRADTVTLLEPELETLSDLNDFLRLHHSAMLMLIEDVLLLLNWDSKSTLINKLIQEDGE